MNIHDLDSAGPSRPRPNPHALADVLDRRCAPPPDREFLRHLTVNTGSLRAYATFLLGSVAEADDLVQETLLRAWRYRASFRSDTNPKAWLFRILRNEFLTAMRRKREVEDVGGLLAARLTAAPTQEVSVRCNDTLRALQRLSPRSREVLALIASGTSYEHAAEICGCSVGTLKSRLNRARHALLRLVDGDEA